MPLLLELGVRGGALVFAVYCVVIMLMPARYLFALTGIALCILGLLFAETHTGPSVVGMVVGVALMGLGVRTVVLERRAAVEEARKAADAAARAARRTRQE